MRVTIICPTYQPNLSYQENVWAEQLTRKGHSVVVIAASDRSHPASTSQTVAVGALHFTVRRAKTIRLPRGIYLSRGVGDLLKQARPELVVMMGDKRFGRDVWRMREFDSIPVISFFSENLGHHEYDWRKPGINLKQRVVAMLYQLLRGNSLRACCKRCVILIGNTPQAADALLPLFRDKTMREAVAAKIIQKPLGFSPEHFFCSAEIRNAHRQHLGIGPDEIVICAASRMGPDKLPILLPIVRALGSLISTESNVTAAGADAGPIGRRSIRPLIVGFDQSPVAMKLEQAIARQPGADRFLRHPFAGREMLNALFNVADIAIFGRASIACQESLATGVQAMFDNAGALNHLATRPDQAVFYSRYDSNELASKLQALVHELQSQSCHERQERRRQRAEAARWLSYGEIVDSVLDALPKSCRIEG